MSASSQMRHLWWRFWWADSYFTRPGLYVWAFGNNRRLLPWR
jgi:hypothetical protein